MSLMQSADAVKRTKKERSPPQAGVNEDGIAPSTRQLRRCMNIRRRPCQVGVDAAKCIVVTFSGATDYPAIEVATSTVTTTTTTTTTTATSTMSMT